MPDFIWIASYPKSGSTWLRFILAHLLFDVGEDKDCIRELVPSLHDWRGGLSHKWEGAHPMKVHSVQQNISPRFKTKMAIFIMRNPLDMVDSALNYMKPESANDRAWILNQFNTDGSIEPWGKRLGYGAWDEHIRSWVEVDNDFPLLVLKYEDLLEAPEENVRKIAEFFSLEVDQKKIDWVVQETSFSAMKKTESLELKDAKQGVFYDEHKYNKDDFKFMRSGKSCGYKENFSLEEINALTNRFRPAMEKYGYL